MKITTSDGKTLNNFENLQNVARKIQNTAVMQGVAKLEDDGKVSYDGHSVAVTDSGGLTAQIPALLGTMRLCNWTGKIHSGSGTFDKKFAECLNFLLAWLCSIGPQLGKEEVLVNIKARVLEDALEWLVPTMKDLDIYSKKSGNCVKQLIKQL
jgi:hypothetical protein